MIWKKYLYKQIFIIFLFLFSAIFFLFVLVDISTRIKSFQSEEMRLGAYFLYYFYQLIRYGEVLVPLAALLTLTKVSLQFSQNRELIALLASGVSRKKLSEPFLIFACLCLCLLFFNYQYLQPTCYLQMAKHTEFEKWDSSPLTPVWMEDQSLFLFRSYLPQTQVVRECIWIKDSDTILHIPTLHLSSAIAPDTEIFTKKNGQNFSFQEAVNFAFPLHLLPKNLHAAFCPYRWQSISLLLSSLPRSFSLTEKETLSASYACYKLTFPLLFFFLYLTALFLCFEFQRFRLGVWIHGFALFGLLFSFTLLKSLLILSESQIFSPYLAFGSVTLIPFIYCVSKYAKL